MSVVARLSRVDRAEPVVSIAAQCRLLKVARSTLYYRPAPVSEDDLAVMRRLRQSLESRFAECGLTLHPEKTKIVYCKDDDRRQDYPSHKFDFLGYTFRPRLSRRRGDRIGVSFSPAVSGPALKAIRQTVRRWSLHERSDKSLEDLARMFNPSIRGWINYYGRYYKSALYPTLRHIDSILARWAHRKFKSVRRHRRRSRHWLGRIARRQPGLFAHWGLLQGRGRITGAV